MSNREGVQRTPGPGGDLRWRRLGAPQGICPNCLARERREGEGRAWLVRITRISIIWKRLLAAGITDPIRWVYTEETIRSAPAIFEDAPVFAFEVSPGLYRHIPAEAAEKPVRGLVGYVCGVQATEGEVFGRLNLISGSEWLQDKLAELARQNRTKLIGLSVDARIVGTLTTTPEEGRIYLLREFRGPASIDVVSHPAAGGAFLQPLKACDTEGALRMRRWLEELRDRRPDLAERLGDAPTEAALYEAMMASHVIAPPSLDHRAAELTRDALGRCGQLIETTVGGSV